MAKKLRSYSFNVSNSKKRKYPWDEWLDGSIWSLTRGEDFDITVDNFRAQCFTRAKQRGLKLQSEVKEDTIIIHAYKEE